eukprot:gene15774-20894_t
MAAEKTDFRTPRSVPTRKFDQSTYPRPPRIPHTPLAHHPNGAAIRRCASGWETEMKKSRFSEEQIIAVLKEHQAGIAVADLCRKHGISDATLYNWRNRYGGMEVSDARRLKALDDENRKLKKLLAESMLDVATLREALGKNF